MKIMVGLFLACGLSLFTTSFAHAEFFYGGDGPIELTVDSTRVSIRLDASVPHTTIFSSVPRLGAILDDTNACEGFFTVSIAPGGGIYAFIDTLNNTPGVLVAEPYYLADDTIALPVGDCLVVSVGPELGHDFIDSLCTSHGTEVVRELAYMEDVYVLRNSDPLVHRLLDLANELHETAGVRYSHPVFGIKPKRFAYTLYDYYSTNQPHIKMITGQFNARSLWDFHGVQDTVVVAVIDDGVIAHEDLHQSRLMIGKDFSVVPYDNNPSPGDEQGHGIACAGIIAASHTRDSIQGTNQNTGVISISSAVKILPVKIFTDLGGGIEVPAQIADGIAYAYQNGAEVLSNSWGYDVPFDLYPVIDDAINRAATQGRNGKGCPVVFAAGNIPGNGVMYPALLNDCVAVGAVQLDGTRWSYSSYGSALDIVAPSGNTNLTGDVWTIDQMGGLGFNPNYSVTWDCASPNDQDYDCHFGGTSAACPLVSGVAAALISRDRNLTRQQIRDCLYGSAVPKGQPIPNTFYGWGRVDAFRAILSIARGDASNDGQLDLSDVSRIVAYLTAGGVIFPDSLLGDWDCSGTVDLNDLSRCIGYMTLPGKPGAPVRPCFAY